MKSQLENIFGEVYQLSNLFIEWDWEKYFAQIGHEESKYNLVNPGIGMIYITH